MIVNPAMYGKGGKPKQVTIHVPDSLTYYMSEGEQKKSVNSGDYLMDVGSIFVVIMSYNIAPQIDNATMLSRTSYMSAWTVNDA